MYRTAGWSDIGQLYAMLPMLVVVMLMATLMKVATKAMEPEFIREAAPLAREAIVVRKYLPLGK